MGAPERVVRHLVDGASAPCAHGVLTTSLDRDGAPRALEYAKLDPCPADGTRAILATSAYVVILPDYLDDEAIILRADTLEATRTVPLGLAGYGACAPTSTELWLPQEPGFTIVDLDTGERANIIDVNGLGLPGTETLYSGGCVSNGEVVYACVSARGPDQPTWIVPIGAADHLARDVDPLEPGLQGYPLPYKTYCGMALDSQRSRLFVEVVDQVTVASEWELLGIVGIDLELLTDSTLLLTGDRSHATYLSLVVLPDGQLFALIQRERGREYEWIRLNPSTGEVTNLRTIRDGQTDGQEIPNGWVRYADGASGDWVLSLVPKPEDAYGPKDLEYINAMTGELGPRFAVPDERYPDALHLLPSVLP